MEITIKSNSAFATINSLGAELKSFKDALGCEHIWGGDAEYWNQSSPVLFPVVGFLKNGETIIDGKTYKIPSHGFAHSKEFRLLYSSDDKAIFSLSYDNDTLEMYPFKFTLQISYYIHGCTLEVKYDVFNQDEKTMPFCIGAHPGFNCPLDDSAPFEDYYIKFPENEIAECPYVDLDKKLIIDGNRKLILNDENQFKLDYSYFAIDALVFDKLKSRKVSMFNLLSGRGVQVEFEQFSMLGIWTNGAKKAPLICLEPWCGCADFDTNDGIFEHKPGIQFAEPSKTKTYKMIITAI